MTQKSGVMKRGAAAFRGRRAVREGARRAHPGVLGGGWGGRRVGRQVWARPSETVVVCVFSRREVGCCAVAAAKADQNPEGLVAWYRGTTVRDGGDDRGRPEP